MFSDTKPLKCVIQAIQEKEKSHSRLLFFDVQGITAIIHSYKL